MKKQTVIMFLYCVTTLAYTGCTDRNSPSAGTSPADTRRNPAYLYDIEAMPEITISLTEADWNTYLKNYDRNKHNDLYVPAAWTFRKGEEVWKRDSVGLRPRGNSSRRRPEGTEGQMHQKSNADWHHAHFGIHFTEYATGERFFGSDRLVLKWFHGDPAYCREIFCYDLFRRFKVWTAPRASYCRLYIHIAGDEKPAYMGVYAMIEGVRKGWIDDRMKDGHLPDNTGNLWKAAYNMNGPADLSDFQSTGTSKMGISDDRHDYSYSLKTNKQAGLPAAKEELYDFMEKMRPLPSGSQQLQQYIEQHTDVDVFLRYLAVNTAVGMWDDYWVNANNYYFYFDSSHRFYFIPYDYDNTLGTSKHIHGMQNSGTQDPLNWGSREGDRLLVRKVLSIKAFEDRYKQYLKTIVTSAELMEPEAAIQRIRHFQQMAEKYVANDTGEDMTIADLPRQDEGDTDYRLLTGDSNGVDGSNFFRTKAASVKW
ncbi:MAG: CotH kinase family protein [Paludibacteraceae bacterium]|nr:CotH kinase family protein [Paludibacteraceae bacterium]